MFQSVKFSTVRGTNHKWEQSILPNRTCVLATNVQEHWTASIYIVVFVILPDPLRISILILIIKVINWRVDRVLNEIVRVNIWKIILG